MKVFTFIIISVAILVAVSTVFFIRNKNTISNQRVSSNKTIQKTDKDRVLIAVGDIGDCNSEYDDKVAELVEDIPGTIALLGDTVYKDGTWEEFMNCFDPMWGKFKSRIKPAVGNHEYHTDGAWPYYQYFGKSAGKPQNGYYSYNLGKWHIVVLNSQLCLEDPDCQHSEQVEWLKKDLELHKNFCTLAYRHHPRFSSGPSSNDHLELPFWEILYNTGADISLTGHDHMYERFPLLNPIGQIDNEHGIRSFVVGTGGGESLHNYGRPSRNSEIKN